jgi:prolipoprotein diacylglyceryltransferase
MTSYPLWVGLGVLAAAIVSRLQPDDRPDLAPQRSALALAAAIGAVAGAYLCELPADLCGWSWSPTMAPDGSLPLGGRTVLGGLLGGWLAVEWLKWKRGITGPTGDGFAAPLAVALACGRLGCVHAGCCAGQVCDAACWWSASDAQGITRYATAHADALFHVIAFIALIVAGHYGWWRGRRLAAYLALYSVVRFSLEYARANPPVLLGLTWYQLIAIMLFALASGTWWRRRVTESTAP